MKIATLGVIVGQELQGPTGRYQDPYGLRTLSKS